MRVPRPARHPPCWRAVLQASVVPRLGFRLAGLEGCSTCSLELLDLCRFLLAPLVTVVGSHSQSPAVLPALERPRNLFQLLCDSVNSSHAESVRVEVVPPVENVGERLHVLAARSLKFDGDCIFIRMKARIESLMPNVEEHAEHLARGERRYSVFEYAPFVGIHTPAVRATQRRIELESDVSRERVSQIGHHKFDER